MTPRLPLVGACGVFIGWQLVIHPQKITLNERTRMISAAKRLRALIVDDESHARENLKMLIDDFCPTVEVVALASSAREAETLVDELDPDLVFLDIMMPGKNGFGFLNALDQRGFEVIFTTAHGEHALSAFREGAVHYLEKPINVDDLLEAVQRAERLVLRDDKPADDELSRLIAQIHAKDSGRTSIATGDGLIFVNYDEIIHLEAQDQYTMVYLTEGRKLLSSRNIKYFEDKLGDRVFFRIHRSFLINVIHHLKAFHRTDGGVVVMSSGVEIPISRRKLSAFMERIQSL